MAETVRKTAKKAVKAAPKKKVSKPSAYNEFAVIATGGKQYVVSAGRVVKIEKLAGKHKEGSKLTFDKVLLVDNGKDTTIGTPYITGAKVTGTLKKSGRSQKVEVMKYKSKSRYNIRSGHRQEYFQVEIESIK